MGRVLLLEKGLFRVMERVSLVLLKNGFWSLGVICFFDQNL